LVSADVLRPGRKVIRSDAFTAKLIFRLKPKVEILPVWASGGLPKLARPICDRFVGWTFK
jgi:hypothetical protein